MSGALIVFGLSGAVASGLVLTVWWTKKQTPRGNALWVESRLRSSFRDGNGGDEDSSDGGGEGHQ